MSNKKNIIISILIVLVIILLVFGSTYAYISAVTNQVNAGTGSGKIDINYNVNPLTGNLLSSSSREKGLSTTASVSLKSGSVDALFNMYITPTVINNLDIPALRWEVEGIIGSEVVYINSGDFDDATVNEPVKIVDSYDLSTTVTTFNIYIWLDESLITEAISNVNFNAKIEADSVPVTGDV